LHALAQASRGADASELAQPPKRAGAARRSAKKRGGASDAAERRAPSGKRAKGKGARPIDGWEDLKRKLGLP
jgi:hypothetical protein